MSPTEVAIGMRVECGTATGVITEIKVAQVCLALDDAPVEIWTSVIHIIEIPTEEQMAERRREVIEAHLAEKARETTAA